MTEKELEKKIESTDKKLAKMKLPRGEGKITWKNKATCYLEYKKTLALPDGTSKRISAYGYSIEDVIDAMRKKEVDTLQEWQIGQRPVFSLNRKRLTNKVILADAIKHWFYKFNYLNKRGRTFDREESTLKNQILKQTSFANIQIRAITDEVIQNFLSELMKKYSYSTVKKTYELLDRFFRYYYSKDVNNNPMTTVVKPKELKEMPITNMTTVINMYKDISTAIQNWGAELEASGTALTADYYQELIKNGSTIISEYKEQAGIIKDVMDTYDVGSDNWNELYSQLQNVNGEMSSMIQNLKKWNEELLQLPLTKISNYSSDLNTVKDALTALQDDYTTVISAVTGAIDDETKAIQDQQKEFQKNIEKQKDAIQDKIDLLDKQNTKLQLQQDLEQKLYNLQIANTQKTEKVK